MTGPKPTKTAGTRGLSEWMTFPVLATAWARFPDKTIARMAAAAAHFQSRSGSGSPAERMRARLIANAYMRVQSLLEELCTMDTSLRDGS